jgi:hypothetical protein
MIRRCLTGLFLGLCVGGLFAVALVMGLKITTFDNFRDDVLGYLAVALSGSVTGLIAGTPIWRPGAKVEGGLKAVFGAMLAAGFLFALRKWGEGLVVDLHALGAGGPAAVGRLPAAALPLVSAAMGTLFELDNTAEPSQEERKPANSARRATQPDRHARIETADDVGDDKVQSSLRRNRP